MGRLRAGGLRLRQGAALLAALLLAAPPAWGDAGAVADFALLDHRGAFHRLRGEAGAPAVVVFVQGNGCPIVRKSVPALQAVRDAFAPRGVVFWMLNANPQDDREAIAAEAEAWGVDVPILRDDAGVVARALGVTRTAEAIVIDPDGWRIRYRGPVDDRLYYEAERPVRAHYLRDALYAVLAGAAVEAPVRETVGCLVMQERAREATPVSYARDVAPILARRCVSCHREGGVAPWAMTGHAAVRGWSPMMREVLLTGRMPPWQADPRFGRFRGDLSLPPEERRTLVEWLEAGAPRGGGPDPLAESPPPPAPEWALGPPDLVLEAPAQEVPAQGVVPYRYETVDVPLERDVFVRAVDLRPSNAAVMHHGLAWIRYPEDEGAPATEGPEFTRGMLAGYVPGRTPWPFPEGTGYRIPAGARIRFQLHYTATGRAERDTPRLALYLADAPLRHELRTGAVASFDFEIPPRAEEHEESASRVLTEDVVLYRLTPHMHLRGKRMRIDARTPDGRTQTLLSVPRYDFNWQHQYVLDPPLRLPAGTRLDVHAAFDNSERNPANPDPDARVRWGEQSFDEMLFGYFLYRPDAELATAAVP